MTNEETNLRALAHDVTDQLAAWRDELRVRAHLVGLDAKDAWKEIEPEVEKAESALRRLLDSTVPGGSEQVRLELRLGIAEVKARLEAAEPRFERLGEELARRGRALLAKLRDRIGATHTHA